jgi:hypothetical protein
MDNQGQWDLDTSAQRGIESGREPSQIVTNRSNQSRYGSGTMRTTKLDRGPLAEERQVDSFWHDVEPSIRYLLVLQESALPTLASYGPAPIEKGLGSVSEITPSYRYLLQTRPELLPGDSGPLSIILVF